jgi:hypothetical protein
MRIDSNKRLIGWLKRKNPDEIKEMAANAKVTVDQFITVVEMLEAQEVLEAKARQRRVRGADEAQT